MMREIFLFCLCICINADPKQETSKELPQKKELLLVKYWREQKNKGFQPFVIESEHEQTTGIFSWDLDENTWKFEYPNSTWEIKDKKLTKKENDQVKTYPCVGFSSFLQHKIETWPDILKKKCEVCNENTCFLLVTYEKRPMIWKYRINPFAILSIAIEDSSGRYYEIDFEVDEVN